MTNTPSGIVTATLRILLVFNVVIPLTHAHPAIEHQLEAVNARLLQQPGDAELLVARGRLYSEHGKYQEALQDFSNAVTREPRLGEGWYWRAATEAQLQRYDAAASSNKRFLSLHLENPYNRPALARAYWQCGNILAGAQKPTEASQCYSKAVAMGGASPEQYLNYIDSLHNSGQHDAAVDAVQQATLAHGELPQLLERAVSIESSRQHYAEAIRWLDRGVVTSLRKPWLLMQKAELQRAMQDEAAAQQSLQAAREAIAALPASKRHSQTIQTLQQQLDEQQQNEQQQHETLTDTGSEPALRQ